MKTLPLAIELSQLAIETSERPNDARFLLKKIERLLRGRSDILGKFTGKKILNQRHLGHDLTLREWQFNFEKSSLQLRLVHFLPRASWQVQDFRFV